MVIPKYGLVGGAEKFVSEVTERCAHNKLYEFHVFSNKWRVLSENVFFHKVPVITFPKFLTTLSFAAAAHRLTAPHTFDLIHAHDRIFDADLFTMHGVPHSFWIRSIRHKSKSLHDRMTSFVEKRLMENPRCRCYMPVSYLAREKILDAYDIDHDKVRVIHPGIDLERFTSLDRHTCKEEMHRRLGIETDERIILFVSMNFEIKGLDRIIEIIAKAQSKKPSQPLRLVVAGKGDEKKYLRMAQEQGIADRVIFTGTWKDGIERLYKASDIMMMLSRFDTFGITVLEAMAASLPVIISDTVGARDIIQNGINGFVIDDLQDTRDVAEIIGRTLQDDTHQMMGEQARRTASLHTWDEVAERTTSVYETLLNRKGQQR